MEPDQTQGNRRGGQQSTLRSLLRVSWLTLALGGAGCTEPSASDLVMQPEPQAHSNGLSIRAPMGTSVATSTQGFIVRPQQWQQLRTPFTLTVERGGENPPANFSAWPTESLDNGTLYARWHTVSGGSGGDLHICESVLQTPEGSLILLTFEQQGEGDRPTEAALLRAVAAQVRL